MRVLRPRSSRRSDVRLRKPDSKLLVGIFGFFFAAYLLVTSARLSSVDDKIMFDVARSILSNGSFASSEPLSEREFFTESWFYVEGKDGRAYGKYGLGQSLAMLPLYALGRAAVPFIPRSYVDWFPADYIPFKSPERTSYSERVENSVVPAFTSLLNPAATAMSCLLVFLLTYYMGSSILSSLATAGIFGFATAAFPYAKYSFQHPLVTALILASFYSLFSWRARGAKWRLVSAGFCLGFAALIRYEAIASLAVLVPYAWWGAFRRVGGTGSGSATDSVTSFRQSGPNEGPRAISQAAGLMRFEELSRHEGKGDACVAPTKRRFCYPSISLGFTKALPIWLSAMANRSKRALPGAWRRVSRATVNVVPFILPVLLFELVVLWFNYVRFGSPMDTGYFQEGFTADLGQSVRGLVLSPGRSILLFSPPTVLGLVCLPAFARRRLPEGAAFAALIVIYFVLYAKWSGWEGGWGWGPRYPLPLLPFLILPLAVVLQAQSFWPRALVLALTLLSLPIQLLGVATNFNDFYMERTVIQGLDFWSTVYDWEQSQIPGHVDLLFRGVIDLWFVHLIRDGAPFGLRAIVVMPLGLLAVSCLLIRRGLIMEKRDVETKA